MSNDRTSLPLAIKNGQYSGGQVILVIVRIPGVLLSVLLFQLSPINVQTLKHWEKGLLWHHFLRYQISFLTEYCLIYTQKGVCLDF